MSRTRIDLTEAERLAAAALAANRTSPANARSVARALVAAEADGLKGHGLARVPSYAAQAQGGKIDGFAVPRLATPRPGVLTVDAACGFAYPAIDEALARLPEMARAQGVAVASFRRSSHCGAMGHHVERLAERGLAALMFANSPSAIAPWGGRRGLFGTNPIAFAAPVAGGAPVVVDLSLSKVARGNLLAARQKGESIPAGWALDAQGRPTTDAAAGLAGTMLPMGDAKGTALAFMVEMLAAGLTGAQFAFEASSYLDAEGAPSQTGQLILALSPEALGGADATAHMARLAREVAQEPGARLPGARRLALRKEAADSGLSLDERLIADMIALAQAAT